MGMRLAPACVLVLIGATMASGQDRWSALPADSLAWWEVEPVAEARAPSEARGQLISHAVRAAASGAVNDGAAMSMLAGLLASSAAAEASHRFALIDLAMEDEAPTLTRFEGVLEVPAGASGGESAEQLHALVEGVFAEDDADEASWRQLDLQEGQKGEAYRRAAWPAWLEVSVAVIDGETLVGIGKDALGDWLKADRDGEGAWGAHRTFVAEARTGRRVVEAYVDLNGLRREAPAWFGPARGGRMLTAWNLANGRLLMVHGHLATSAEGLPPLLVVDATWEVRSESPGQVHHRAVTGDVLPDGGIEAPLQGDAMMVAPARLLAWIDRGVRTYAATQDQETADALMDRIRRWARGSQTRVARFQQAMGVVVLSSARSIMPGMSEVELDRSIARDVYERELERLMASLGDDVTFDATSQTWTLHLPPLVADGRELVLAWGLAGTNRTVFVAGWGEDAVRAVRNELDGK